MKRIFASVAGLLTLTVTAFAQTEPGVPLIKPEEILKNKDSFTSYIYDNFKLSRDITTYDENLNNITKQVFLKQLCTGQYMPLRLKSK